MKTKSIPLILFIILAVGSGVAGVILKNFEIFAGGCLIAATILIFWMIRGELEGKGIAIALYVTLAAVLVGSVVSETVLQNRNEYYSTWSGSYQGVQNGIILSIQETSKTDSMSGEYYLSDNGTGFLKYGVIHGYYSYTGDNTLKLDCKALKNPVVVQSNNGIIFLYEDKDGIKNIYAEKMSDTVMNFNDESSVLDYTDTSTK